MAHRGSVRRYSRMSRVNEVVRETIAVVKTGLSPFSGTKRTPAPAYRC